MKTTLKESLAKAEIVKATLKSMNAADTSLITDCQNDISLHAEGLWPLVEAAKALPELVEALEAALQELSKHAHIETVYEGHDSGVRFGANDEGRVFLKSESALKRAQEIEVEG